MPATTPGPEADLIDHAAGIIAAERRKPHTGPYHWAGALWQAGMLVPPGTAKPAEDEPHLIQLRADGFTIQHPLRCRPNLFACRINQVAHFEFAEPPAQLGVFECELNEAGDRIVVGAHVGGEPS